MKFTHLTIKNFLTIKDAEARLDERGLVLVQGDNRDDTSQNSNGAGKSSLADAVSWALFGVTARGESGNDVINNKVKRGGASVTLEIDDAGAHYKVERTRLKGKGTLELCRKDKGKWHTLTKGTTKLTQEAITKLIGCSADVFANAIYSGQEKTPDLPGMTDKALKMLIEEAAGINRLERAYKVARERMNDVAKAIDVKETRLASNQRIIDDRKDNVDSYIALQSDWEDKKKSDLKTMAVNIRDLQSKAENAKAHFDSLNKSKTAIETKLNEVNDKLNSIDKFRKNEAAAQAALNSLLYDLKMADSALTSVATKAKGYKAELAKVGDIEGSPCDSCGKPYTADDVEPRRASLKADLDRAINDYKTAKASCEEINEKITDAESKLKTAQRAVPDTTKEIKRRDELSDSLRAIANAERDANDAARRVREEMARLKKLRGDANPYDSQLVDARKRLKDAEDEYVKLHQEVKDAEADLELKRAAAQVFGPAGVRAHILDTVTPFLNERTNNYLSTLTDGNISAVWSTIDTNAKGEVKEKFGISVQSKVGSLTFRGLSGGEKRKARLACSMALQDLVSSRATKPIELYIADEIDHALDESGLERLMDILEDKASDRGTVLVISHNSLSDWIRNQVTVIKEGGVSRIEGGALA